MVYSLLLHKEIPVKLEKEIIFSCGNYDDYMTRYTAYEKNNPREIGYVDLQDTRNGVKVLYIKNQQPHIYRHFGYLADQIEVEHCLKRGIEKPYIQSLAAIGSPIKHFKRGKRFINEGVNAFLTEILKNLQKNEFISLGFLGVQKMYMPMNMINEIKEKIKKRPLLKGLR